MIKEHDCVALTIDLPDQLLTKGDVGAVVLIYEHGRGYEVEFVTFSGETVALVTLTPSQVRPIGRGEIAHVRSVELETIVDLS